MTLSQNLALFVLLDPQAEHLLAAIGAHPSAIWSALARTSPSSRIFTCVFHVIMGTDSTGSRARIPRDDGHGFHGMVGSDSTGSWAP